MSIFAKLYLCPLIYERVSHSRVTCDSTRHSFTPPSWPLQLTTWTPRCKSQDIPFFPPKIIPIRKNKQLENSSREEASEGAQKDDSDWVRLQSNDGFSYLVRKKVAQTSGTIRTMLDPSGGYAEANSNICSINERYVLCTAWPTELNGFRGIIVEKLVEYMSFKAHYENVGSKEEIPIRDLLERIPPEIVLEL